MVLVRHPYVVLCAFGAALTLWPNHASADDAAQLAFCPGNVSAPHAVGIVRNLGESTLLLQRASEPIGGSCTQREIVLPIDRVRWLGVLPSHAVRNSRGLTMVSRADDGQIMSLEPDAEQPSTTRSLLPGGHLLPALELRAFGVDARAEVQERGSAIELRCRAGDAQAGVVLRLGRAPAGLAAAIALEAAGDAGFRVQLTSHGTDASQAGIPFTGTQHRQSARLEIPSTPSDIALVIACPTRAAQLRLTRAGVEPMYNARVLERSAWVWESEAWESYGDGLIAWARRERLRKILLTIRVENQMVARPRELADFIRRARAGGLSVIAAEGDPEMISTSGLAHALARAAALADYQRAYPDARLAGFQYDIEPYVAPGFAADPARAWRMWASALTRLSAVLRTRVDAVLPFWLLDSEGGPAALDAAVSALDRITIMAYRTEPGAVLAAAAPLVEWASPRNVPVAIALESGALPAERRDRFVPAPDGELHLVGLGDLAGAILLDRPQPAMPGATAFSRISTTSADQGRLTFHGQPDRLAAAVGEITRDLAAWPIAVGIAMHGLDWRGAQHKTNGGTP
jgi:hypothetical protein